MKRITIYSAAACLLAACSHGEVYDAAGTFEATEITLSAETAGRILTLDAELGDRLRANRAVGCIDTLQLSLQRRQLERQRASVATTRPDIAKQAASLREQIAKQRTERQRVENLLRDGAATTKQLDDIDAQLRKSRRSTTGWPNAASYRPWTERCWANTPKRAKWRLSGGRC